MGAEHTIQRGTNMTDSLSERAARARAEQLSAEADARAAQERAQELRRREELRELQDIPSAHEARKAADEWFAQMGVGSVRVDVTGRRHDSKRINDDGYMITMGEWVSTFVTWQLEGNSYYGDYREWSIRGEERCNETSFTVEVAIRDGDGNITRRQANTLAQLGTALEGESPA